MLAAPLVWRLWATALTGARLIVWRMRRRHLGSVAGVALQLSIPCLAQADSAPARMPGRPAPVARPATTGREQNVSRFSP
jgi:hypothetical protein